MALLSRAEIRTSLSQAKGWKLKGNEIQKTYTFNDFRQSISFVNRVAELAEKADHHPDIFIAYDHVTLTLSTHDEGGLTSRDFRLAGKIDSIML